MHGPRYRFTVFPVSFGSVVLADAAESYVLADTREQAESEYERVMGAKGVVARFEEIPHPLMKPPWKEGKP